MAIWTLVTAPPCCSIAAFRNDNVAKVQVGCMIPLLLKLFVQGANVRAWLLQVCRLALNTRIGMSFDWRQTCSEKAGLFAPVQVCCVVPHTGEHTADLCKV